MEAKSTQDKVVRGNLKNAVKSLGLATYGAGKHVVHGIRKSPRKVEHGIRRTERAGARTVGRTLYGTGRMLSGTGNLLQGSGDAINQRNQKQSSNENQNQNEQMNPPINEPMNPPINEPMNESMDPTMNAPTNTPINQNFGTGEAPAEKFNNEMPVDPNQREKPIQNQIPDQNDNLNGDNIQNQ